MDNDTIIDLFNKLEEGQKRIEKKIDSVGDQAMDMTVFKTTVISMIEEIKADIDFIEHKKAQIEKDVFVIKQKLGLIN